MHSGNAGEGIALMNDHGYGVMKFLHTANLRSGAPQLNMGIW